MISKNIIYKYGHFYNTETGKRLIMKEDSQMILLVPDSDGAFLESDLLQTRHFTRTDKVIEDELGRRKGFRKCSKLLDAHAKLFFNISSGFEQEGTEKRVNYTFELYLNESLFIYQTSSSSLTECSCTVQRVVGLDMPFFEPIEAYSLNDAYMKTFVHYFNTFGKGTCNAFDTFYQDLGRKPQTRIRHLRTKAGFDNKGQEDD